MSHHDFDPAEDELVIALTPAQVGIVLMALVVSFVLIRARRAR